jgi:acetylornithine deacetylase/succinyl-diaminopimelate desuccinylase-like protein
LLSNPGVRLIHALASMVDRNGRILVPALLPKSLPDAVRRALADVEVGVGPTDPAIDPNWGEPGLTPPERVFGWNTLEVLAYKTGNPDLPSNAIPGSAYARCQLRFVVGTDYDNLLQHIRSHLDGNGYTDVEVELFGTPMAATRLDPDDAWVRWAMASIESTTGTAAWVLPNLGGSLSNDAFSEVLGLPTVWVPHSYPACSQHAPGEHLLGSVAREALQIMAGMFWDLGEQGSAVMASRSRHGA